MIISLFYDWKILMMSYSFFSLHISFFFLYNFKSNRSWNHIFDERCFLLKMTFSSVTQEMYLLLCSFFPFCKCDIRTTNVLYKMCNQYPICPYLQVSDLLPQEWTSSVSYSQPSFSWPVLPFLHKMNWQM